MKIAKLSEAINRREPSSHFPVFLPGSHPSSAAGPAGPLPVSLLDEVQRERHGRASVPLCSFILLSPYTTALCKQSFGFLGLFSSSFLLQLTPHNYRIFCCHQKLLRFSLKTRLLPSKNCCKASFSPTTSMKSQ